MFKGLDFKRGATLLLRLKKMPLTNLSVNVNTFQAPSPKTHQHIDFLNISFSVPKNYLKCLTLSYLHTEQAVHLHYVLSACKLSPL